MKTKDQVLKEVHQKYTGEKLGLVYSHTETTEAMEEYAKQNPFFWEQEKLLTRIQELTSEKLKLTNELKDARIFISKCRFAEHTQLREDARNHFIKYTYE